MARFRALDEVQIVQSHKNHPFHNIYGAVEGDMVYINMEAIDHLKKGMTTQRDMYLVVDISGSMEQYYKRKGFFSNKPSEIETLISTIVDSVAPYDDDGIDVLFFGSFMVYRANISSASEVPNAVERAMRSRGAFSSTMPIDSFKAITAQMEEKHRPATVFFLTDGAMDDDGDALRNYYKNVLHTKWKTRDWFYCYSIEFGDSAEGALNVLDGLFPPEQGPEDLFDLENVDNLSKITEVLRQVGAMSAIGSNDELVATVSNGCVIDMVNADLISGGQQSIAGSINQVMSFRVRANQPFELSIRMAGYEEMKLVCTPKGFDVDIRVA
ncbi:VWA domain-containing protein [Fodinisporobacter ferrooxydans]|uniref:VWA domain-containing protein n=1 Tax=Fodinisporobacter ferrooxydans TaxID=2901836 RepID=A0ABY4CPV9_9BACL|nr:VWA domain-containing protein [Alicyclobacillaceae bacterium MYW30-H2]